jgi:hypothetical protein
MRRPLRLDEQMHVIRLNAELEDAEFVIGGLGQRMAYDGKQDPSAEGTDTGGRAQRRVDGIPCMMRWSGSVHDQTPTE